MKRAQPQSTTASAMITVGIALQLTGGLLHGFLRGLLQGAGIALILLGVIILSPQMRRRRHGQERRDGMWLPSRESDER